MLVLLHSVGIGHACKMLLQLQSYCSHALHVAILLTAHILQLLILCDGAHGVMEHIA